MARRVDPTEQALNEIKEAKEQGKTKLSINATSMDVARKACEVTTVTDLSLSGGLTELPEEMGNLVDLDDLSITNMQLTELPASIGKLTKLTALRCYGNKLKRFPEELGQLVKLKKIVAFSNEIEKLPESIGNLVALTELELQRNKLTTLPASFGQLAALEQLEIASNELVDVPRTLAGCRKLYRVEFGRNKFTKFPLGLLDLAALRELDLSDNQIDALPDDIRRLGKLEILKLGENKLKALPAGIYELRSLTSLELSQNEITSIDKAVGKLTELSTLDLTENPVGNIPAEALAIGKDGIFEHLGLITAAIVEGDLPPDVKEVVKAYQPRLDQFARECKKKSHSREMLPKLLDFIAGKSNVVPPIRRDDHYGFSTLPRHLANFPEWTFIDRRIARYIAGPAFYYRQPGHDYFTGYYDDFYSWLKPHLEAEPAGGDLFARVTSSLAIDNEVLLRSSLRELGELMVRGDNTPSSYGRWVLSQVATQLPVIVELGADYSSVRDGVIGLLVGHDFAAFEKAAPKLLALEPSESGETHVPYGAYDKLCAVDAAKYTPMVIDATTKTKCLGCRAELAKVLVDRCGPGQRKRAMSLATETLAGISEARNKEDRLWFSFDGKIGDGVAGYVDWALRTFGKDVKTEAFAFAENTRVFDLEVAEAIARHLGQDGVDALAEGLNMTFEDDDIAPHFRRIFAILAPLDWSKYHDKAWELARSEQRQVRHTACGALAKLGRDVVLDKALALIGEKKAHVREAGVLIASQLAGDPVTELEELLESETSDDVRDLIVERRYAGAGKVTAAEIGKRVASAKERGKLGKPVAKWLDEKKLGAVVYKGGKKLDADTVRFMLHRQTRLADIGPEAEVRGIYPLIDRAKSAAFAEKLLALVVKNGGVSAKNRFALSVIGLVGGDGVINTLEEICIDAHNENAATTLGLLGTPEAARALDRIMKAFRTKYPNVRETAQDAFDHIAETMGISRFELADSMIPDFGFKKGQGAITLGKVKATVTIGGDRKLEFRDTAGKLIKSPGKGLTGKAKEALETLRDDVDTASRTLKTNLEYYMVSGRRWDADKWRAFFLGNPLAFAFARSLVWGIPPWRGMQASFRIAEDKQLLDVEGSPLSLGKDVQIALLHALDIDDPGREAWQAALEADGLVPPFAQMARPVFVPKVDDRVRTMSFEFENKELNGLTFKSRAERLGWRRGSVVDGGGVSAYRKLFERHQIEAFIGTENLAVQSWDAGDVTLETLFFVKAGAVETGSYTYDEPRDPSDARLIKLGDLPAIVYSETIADLQTVTREKVEAAAD